MKTTKPSQTWHSEDPPDFAFKVLQLTLAELEESEFKVILNETNSELGTWPYVDAINHHTWTVQSRTASAVIEWEFGQNDGSMETWTSLHIQLYGSDPFLLATFNAFFREHIQK